MAQPALKEQTLEERALTYPEQARALTINNSADYLAAGEFVKSVDALAKEVEASFKPGIQKAHDLHKSLIAERDRHLKPLTEAKTTTKRLMVSYDQAQEQKRREEEARLREEARRIEEEAKLAAALEAEAAGELAEADAIMQEEVYVPPVIVKKETPKVTGIRFQTTWRWRITDAGKIPREFMLPDSVKIGQVVRAMKGSTNIPGIEAYPERG